MFIMQFVWLLLSVFSALFAFQRVFVCLLSILFSLLALENSLFIGFAEKIKNKEIKFEIFLIHHYNILYIIKGLLGALSMSLA